MDEGRASDGLLLVGAAGAAVWVLTWLLVQLHDALGAALPSMPPWG